MATPGLLKIKILWNKGDGVKISVYEVTNKILSRDSNHIVDVVMWPKLGNSSISMREVIIKTWPEKLLFLSCDPGSSSIIWDWQ